MKNDNKKLIKPDEMPSISGGNNIDKNQWSNALIDCVGGDMDSLLGKPIEQSEVNQLVRRAISPFWSGNVYRYRF